MKQINEEQQQRTGERLADEVKPIRLAEEELIQTQQETGQPTPTNELDALDPPKMVPELKSDEASDTPEVKKVEPN